MFNEEDFMNSSYSDATSTKRPILPARKFQGQITELKPRQSQGKKDPSKVYTFLDVKLKVQLPPDVQAEIGANSADWTWTTGISLDLDSSGKIDMRDGRNIQLGQLREAAGQNNPGSPWKMSDLLGAFVAFEVKHQQDDSGEMRDRLKNWLTSI